MQRLQSLFYGGPGLDNQNFPKLTEETYSDNKALRARHIDILGSYSKINFNDWETIILHTF